MRISIFILCLISFTFNFTNAQIPFYYEEHEVVFYYNNLLSNKFHEFAKAHKIIVCHTLLDTSINKSDSFINERRIFDNNGKLIEIYDDTNNKLEQKFVYDNNQMLAYYYSIDINSTDTISFLYDNNLKLIEKHNSNKLYSYDKTVYCYNGDSILTKSYGINQKDTQSGDTSPTFTNYYEFGINKKIKKITMYLGKDLYRTINYMYDSDNNIIERNDLASDGHIDKMLFIYDNDGLLKKLIESTGSFNDNIFIGQQYGLIFTYEFQ